MPEQVAYINVRAPWKRLLLVLPAAAALFGAWHGVLWCAGRTMAEYTPDLKTAEAAVRVAPRDPHAHLKLARVNFRSLLPERAAEALRGYDTAASLAPNDYLVWLEVGRVRGSAGDTEGGERALRRAVELAPNYAQPRWHLGNLLLRVGRDEEAFAELRRAADAEPTLRPQVFNYAWRVYEGDLTRVLGAVGSSPHARAQLAAYLVHQKRVDDSLGLWGGLSPAERREQGPVAQQILAALFDAKRFRAALALYRETQPEGAALASAGAILNGGFEDDIGAPGPYGFGWRVAPAQPPTQIAIDPRVGRGGARSLRLSFASVSNFDHKNVTQLVIVEPGARYRLNYGVRTDDLKSASTPVVEIVDAADGVSVISHSAPLAVGTFDWQQQTVEFTTGAKTEAVVVRLSRSACESAECPIFGKVWYDDFNLERAGAAPAR